jgi:hypothetical protein
MLKHKPKRNLIVFICRTSCCLTHKCIPYKDTRTSILLRLVCLQDVSEGGHAVA